MGVVFNTSYGQIVNKREIDEQLTDQYNEMINADFSVRYDSLAPLFKSQLDSVLALPASFTIPFDSLRTRIKITESNDNNLRIFSWDEKSGGNWHDMTSIAQFKTATGKIDTKQLNSGNEAETGEYTDVVILKIHEIIIDHKKYYLTIGYGTHGSGHHHMLGQIFNISNNELIKCESCFDGFGDLVIEAPRSEKINLAYDSDKKELSYNEFQFEDSSGFYRPTGKIMSWKLIDGVFKKKPFL